MKRNQCSRCGEIGVHVCPKSVFTFRRNTQLDPTLLQPWSFEALIYRLSGYLLYY